MSGMMLGAISAAENEFIAEETLVTITSSVDHPAFFFLSGQFGPLVAGFPCDVPLWFAITLRRKGKCAIQIPSWMAPEELERNVKNEREQSEFEPLPFHYIEIAFLLLNHAREDIPMADKISALLQDLENIRMDRLRQNFRSMSATVSEGEKILSAQVNHIAAMEILQTKAFVVESAKMFRRLTEVEQQQTSLAAGGAARSATAAFAADDEEVDGGNRRQLRRFNR